MDRDAARLMGISIRNTYALTFAIGAALAGAAGAMLSELYPFDPSGGGTFTLRAFVIVVLGGLGTPWGVLAGGLVFGLLKTVAQPYPGIGPACVDPSLFPCLFPVLSFPPPGCLAQPSYLYLRAPL